MKRMNKVLAKAVVLSLIMGGVHMVAAEYPARSHLRDTQGGCQEAGNQGRGQGFIIQPLRRNLHESQAHRKDKARRHPDAPRLYGGQCKRTHRTQSCGSLFRISRIQGNALQYPQMPGG